MTAILACVLATLQFITDPENNYYPILPKKIHEKLKDVILGIDAAQLTTSCAVVAATDSSYGATADYHAFLALGLAVMTSCSQLTPMVTLSHTKWIGSWALVFRLSLGLVQLSLVAWLHNKQVGLWPDGCLDTFPYAELVVLLVCIVLSFLMRHLYLSMAIFDFFEDAPSANDSAITLRRAMSWLATQSRNCIRRSKAPLPVVWICIATSWITTGITAGFVLYSKYGHGYKDCNMHDPKQPNQCNTINPDTDWSFGQSLSGAVIVAIPFSVIEAILSELDRSWMRVCSANHHRRRCRRGRQRHACHARSRSCPSTITAVHRQ